MFVFEEGNIGRRGVMAVGQGQNLGRFEGAWNTTSTLNAGKLGGKFIPTALK